MTRGTAKWWMRTRAGLVCLAVLLIASGVSADQHSGTDTELAKATFAGGCFWCMEPPYDALEGVVSTTSGFIGGHTENPTYQDVVTGHTGHFEAVQVVYDPSRISYERLLEVFWVNIDPTDPGGQFCDRGDAYRSGIFFHNDEQQRFAEHSKAALEAGKDFKEPIVTAINAATPFYAAEEYHQNYYQKNPLRYRFYRANCGRDQRLKTLWGDHADLGNKEMKQ